MTQKYFLDVHRLGLLLDSKAQFFDGFERGAGQRFSPSQVTKKLRLWTSWVSLHDAVNGFSFDDDFHDVISKGCQNKRQQVWQTICQAR
jgi:hypothetical protein